MQVPNFERFFWSNRGGRGSQNCARMVRVTRQALPQALLCVLPACALQSAEMLTLEQSSAEKNVAVEEKGRKSFPVWPKYTPKTYSFYGRVEDLHAPSCDEWFDPDVCCELTENEKFKNAPSFMGDERLYRDYTSSRPPRGWTPCGDYDSACAAHPAGVGEPALLKEDPSDGSHAVLRITNPIPHSGIVAILQNVMNQLKFAQDHNMTAFVELGQCNAARPGEGTHNPYYDASYGSNVWDYFFYQPHGFSAVEASRRGRVVQLTATKVWRLFGDNWDTGFELGVDGQPILSKCPANRSAQVYWVGCWAPVTLPLAMDITGFAYSPKLDAAVSIQRRAGYRGMQLIRIKEEIVAAAERMIRLATDGKPFLGVHVRWSDKQAFAGRVVRPKEYFPHIDAYLKRRPDAKVFVATADPRPIPIFADRYGSDRILSVPTDRIEFNAFDLPVAGAYQRGVSVLTDAIILSKADYLLHGSAGVPELAVWLSKDMRLDERSLNLNYCREESCDCSFYFCK